VRPDPKNSDIQTHREVHDGDGVAFLRAAPLAADVALVTSLPDVSELAMSLDDWREWFIGVASLACRQTHAGAVTMFFQSDIVHDGQWVDKGHLVSLAAERARVPCVFHKIVCRAPAGKAIGRPGFSHLQAFSRTLSASAARGLPDVLPRLGAVPWARAMGVEACELVCRYLLDFTSCRNVLDPFCGVGTMLAIANNHGMGAIGVEIAPRRAARARTLRLRGSERPAG
jgi:hypothetical protein